MASVASSTRGVQIYMSNANATATSVVPTAISAAKPAVVTVAAVTGITKGDIVKMSGTGFKELDGKTFVVGAVDGTGNTFVLVGSDTTGSTAALGATPKADVFPISGTGTVFTGLCLSELSISSETPGTIAVSTFCNPSATLPSSTTSAGTIQIGGYVDINDSGYKAILAAEADGKPRDFVIQLPGALGSIVANGTISSVSFGVPLEGAVSWSTTLTLSTKPVHVF